MQLPSVSSHGNMTKISPNERRYSRLIGYAIGFVILLIVVGVLLYLALYKYNILPISSNVLVEDAVAAVLGIVIIFFLGKEIELASSRLFGPKRGNMIFVVFRFVTEPEDPGVEVEALVERGHCKA